MAETSLQIAQRLELESKSGALRPTWGDHKRPVSKPLARSALFSVSDKRLERAQYKDHRVASFQGTEIRYTGEELRQDDQDVFMQLVHVMRARDLGTEVDVMGCDLLRMLGWGDRQSDYERLFLCIKRLLEGTVWVYNPDVRGVKLYGSHLIHSVAGEDADQQAKDEARARGEQVDNNLQPSRTRWKLTLDRNLANIMCNDSLTLVDWLRHCSLTPLAKWFHVFYSTHKEPYAMSPAKFRELCGSKQKALAPFRQRIHRALTELVKKGFLETYDYDEKQDLFAVRRAREGQLQLGLSDGQEN